MMLSDAEQSQRDPEHSQYSHADVYTSLECLSGLLAALYRRERTGQGQHVEVAMAQTMLAINEHVSTDLWATARGMDPPTAARGFDPVMQLRDGTWVTAAGDPAAPEGFT